MKLRLSIRYLFARRCLKCRKRAHYRIRVKWRPERHYSPKFKNLYACWQHREVVQALAVTKAGMLEEGRALRMTAVQFPVWFKEPPPDPDMMAEVERELRSVR